VHIQRLQCSGCISGWSDWCYLTEDLPRMCVSWVAAFHCIVFEVLTPKVDWSFFQNGVPKSVFGESNPLIKNFKISLQNNSCLQWLMPSCQVSWKLVHGIHNNKNNNFRGLLFPYSHSSAKFCPNPSCFICKNVLCDHYIIGMKPVCFSPTITYTDSPNNE